MVEIIAEITRVADGVTVRVPRNEDAEAVYFQWGDGNYGCDCNRSLMFGDAKAPCGTTAYRVRVMCGDEVLYDDATDRVEGMA